MSPSEKADELISKFFGYVNWGIEDADYIARENAKQCAIICVEQIIEAAKNIDNDLEKLEGIRMYPEVYWKEVLTHIKNS